MLAVLLVAFLIAHSFAQLDQPSIGFKGPQTPNCADGTIYATSRSSCAYPSAAINSWMQQNGGNYQQLYATVAVQTTIPANSYPRTVSGKEICDYVEDYPVLQWVFSPDLGWMPVMQSIQYPQYFRLESCTSTGKCSTECRTFHTRQRVLVWDGQQPVSTVVLLPYACKCLIPGIQLPTLPPQVQVIGPIVSATCNPYFDCRCTCPLSDSNCADYRSRNNPCVPAATPQQCNSFIDCSCRCPPGDYLCQKFRLQNDLCGPPLICNPYLSCECDCAFDDYECVVYRVRHRLCLESISVGPGFPIDEHRICNPYLSCECDCTFDDYECVKYRAEHRLCDSTNFEPWYPLVERFGTLEGCDPYIHCGCPCRDGDWKCPFYRRTNRICEDRELDELFYDLDEDRRRRRHRHHHRRHRDESRSDESDSDDEHRRRRRHRHHSDRDDTDSGDDSCSCDEDHWGPWCNDPIWKCLTDHERLQRIG